MVEKRVKSPKLRSERDRFVAFAFASADLLIEFDSSEAVSFVAGATEGLLGKTPVQLAGMPFDTLISPEARPVVRQLVRDMAEGRRADPA